jgi:hypothetical protein
VEVGLSLQEINIDLFKNGTPRRIFGPKREKVSGGFRKLHNEELHNVCSSSNIIRVMKSRRVRWACHVACMGHEHASDCNNEGNVLKTVFSLMYYFYVSFLEIVSGKLHMLYSMSWHPRILSGLLWELQPTS